MKQFGMEEQESLIKPEKKIKVSHCIRPCWHKSYSLSQKYFFFPFLARCCIGITLLMKLSDIYQNSFRTEIIFSVLYPLTHYAVNVLCYAMPFFALLYCGSPR